jgi:ribonuclease T1
MKLVRTILLVALALFVAYVKFSTLPPASHADATAPAATPVQTAQAPTPSVSTNPAVPDKALHVLEIVRSTGQPPEGYVGGRVFENRENRLPAGGDYREFDVDPHNGQRNAERLIVEWNSKKAWYTGDHYQTFTPLP